MKKAMGLYGSAIVQLKWWAPQAPLVNAGAGVSNMFFPDSCEIASFWVTSGLVDLIVDDVNGVRKPPDSPRNGAIEGGVQAGFSGGLEIAWMTGPSPADAKSFAGIFRTLQGGRKGVGVSGYVGVTTKDGKTWRGGTAGVGADVVPLPVSGGTVAWNYRPNGEPVRLLELPGGKCACYALTALMPSTF